MAHALRLGARGLGRTWPNPAVGCVITNGSRIVGRGWTQPGGRPHAETMALQQAGPRAQGATAYVTLEPCAHHGHTPPCAAALIDAGIARVVTALTDPDPRVAGRGHTMLRAAGIAVTEGSHTTAATRLATGFLKRVTQGLPFATLKLATSLDGRIATGTGQSRWITGHHARRMVHTLRLTHDAVLTGSGTARADDPDLTVRDIGAQHQPVRIVIDTHLSHRPDSRLGQTARTAPVWMIHACTAPNQNRAAWATTGATLIEVPNHGAHVDLSATFRALAGLGLTRILVECGGTLAAALLRQSLIDDLALFTAGLLIGTEGHPAIGPLALPDLPAAPRATLRHTQSVGPDTFSLWSLT